MRLLVKRIGMCWIRDSPYTSTQRRIALRSRPPLCVRHDDTQLLAGYMMAMKDVGPQ